MACLFASLRTTYQPNGKYASHRHRHVCQPQPWERHDGEATKPPSAPDGEALFGKATSTGLHPALATKVFSTAPRRKTQTLMQPPKPPHHQTTLGTRWRGTIVQRNTQLWKHRLLQLQPQSHRLQQFVGNQISTQNANAATLRLK